MANKIKDIFTKEKVSNFFKSLIKSPILYITLFAIAADFISKQVIMHTLEEGQSINLIGTFIIVTYVRNPGAIFSLGADSKAAHIAFIVIRAIIAVVLPIIYLFKAKGVKMRYRVCIMLIYAGCVGNLIDGLFYYNPQVGMTCVTDWILMPFPDATFNLADSYITVCVILLIIFILVDEIKEALVRNRKGEFSMTPEEYEKKMKEQKEHEDNHK